MDKLGQRLICVGQFGGSYAVQGWVKLQSFTEPDDAIFSYQPWCLLNHPGVDIKQNRSADNQAECTGKSLSSVFVVADEKLSRQKLELTASRRHGRGFVVKLAGIDTPEQAQRLAGQSIFVAREKLPALRDGQYYWVDLFDLAVEDQQGHLLGRVADMLETGANDVLVVKSVSGDEILIPYVMDHYITRVDMAAGKIVVNWDVDWDIDNDPG